MLTTDESLALLAAARDAATEAGVPMSFAVMDPHGHLLGLVRMDDALWITADVAQGKAWTAAAYGAPTTAQKELLARSAISIARTLWPISARARAIVNWPAQCAGAFSAAKLSCEISSYRASAFAGWPLSCSRLARFVTAVG